MIAFDTCVGHYAKEDVDQIQTKLATTWEDLLTKLTYRSKDLDESLTEQQYFANSREVEAWLKEKEFLVSSEDFGKDKEAAEVSVCHAVSVKQASS